MMIANHTKKCLLRLNYIAGIVHLTAAVSVFLVGLLGYAPYNLTLYHDRANTQKVLDDNPQLSNVTCGGEVHDNVFEWFDCIRAANATAVPRESPERHEVEFYVYGVWWSLASFALVTATFHFVANVLGDVYIQWLTRRIQPLRWWEYASTYTTMTICIFALNMQTDVYVFVLLAVSAMAQMLIGYAIEYTNQAPSESLRPAWERQRCVDIYLCKRLNGTYDWPKLILHWGLYEISFVIMASHFYIIWDSFIDAFRPYLESDASDLWGQLYGFILAINVFILCAYSIFPVIHVATYCHRTVKCYIYGEIAYILASMTAKIGLIAIVFSGIINRP